MRTHSLALILLFTALIAYTYAIRSQGREGSPAPDLDLIPKTAGRYSSTDETQDAKNLEVLGADKTLFRTYRSGLENTAWLFIGYFGSQHENSQIHSPKHCYPGGGWNILEEGWTELSIGRAERAVKHLVISDGVETQFVLYWFMSADGIITNEFALKWNQMRSSLLGRPQATAFIRFSAVLPGGEADTGAKNGLSSLAEALAPHIEGVLGGHGEASTSRERM